MEQFTDEETSGLLYLDLLGIRMNKKENVKNFNQRFITLLNRIPFNLVEAVQIEYYTVVLPPNIAMFVKNKEKQTVVDKFAEAIKVEKNLATISNYLGNEENEVSMESNMDRVISQLQDEVLNLKMNKGEGKKHLKKRISTNTSLKVLPTLGINLEDYAMDNFCRTHCAYHSKKTCPEFTYTLKELLLPPESLEKENKDVVEENYEDEEGEAEELKESEHPPNLKLVWDEIALDNMYDDLMKEYCVRIDYKLWSKEYPSTSRPTPISSTPIEKSTKEFLEKDEENEKDSTINPMVNDSSNPNKRVMSFNSIIDNSYVETLFGRSNVELSSFANSYKQSELLPCN